MDYDPFRADRLDRNSMIDVSLFDYSNELIWSNQGILIGLEQDTEVRISIVREWISDISTALYQYLFHHFTTAIIVVGIGINLV